MTGQDDPFGFSPYSDVEQGQDDIAPASWERTFYGQQVDLKHRARGS